jgi:phage terminase large subunit GpA-like protein
VPHKSSTVDVASLSANELTGRQWTTPKGLIPQDAIYVAAGCDLGKWHAYYQAFAFSPIAATKDSAGGWRAVLFDYDKIEVESARLGVEPALLQVLRTFRQRFEAGWTWQGHGETRSVDMAGIDMGWQGGPEGPSHVGYQFIRECQADPATRDRYWATKGFGEGQFAGANYHAPKKTGATVLLIGDSYHVAAQPASGIQLIEFDADAWKTHFHERLACDRNASAVLLHQAVPKTHLTVARHWTAEKQQTEFVPGRGEVTKWIRLRQTNHYLDCGVIASLIGHFLGVRIVREPRPPRSEARSHESDPPAVHTPDGRPFLITER